MSQYFEDTEIERAEMIEKFHQMRTISPCPILDWARHMLEQKYGLSAPVTIDGVEAAAMGAWLQQTWDAMPQDTKEYIRQTLQECADQVQNTGGA